MLNLFQENSHLTIIPTFYNFLAVIKWVKHYFLAYTLGPLLGTGAGSGKKYPVSPASRWGWTKQGLSESCQIIFSSHRRQVKFIFQSMAMLVQFFAIFPLTCIQVPKCSSQGFISIKSQDSEYYHKVGLEYTQPTEFRLTFMPIVIQKK